MKFILLTPVDYTLTHFYLAISRILAIEVYEDGTTWVNIDKVGQGRKVKETAEQIFELIKQQEQA
jgi:hypothetical protein